MISSFGYHFCYNPSSFKVRFCLHFRTYPSLTYGTYSPGETSQSFCSLSFELATLHGINLATGTFMSPLAVIGLKIYNQQFASSNADSMEFIKYFIFSKNSDSIIAKLHIPVSPVPTLTELRWFSGTGTFRDLLKNYF